MKSTKSTLLPREKALKFGLANLEDYELLAIILKTGANGMDVLDLARSLADAVYPISKLSFVSLYELTCFKGIGKAKALEILAAIELGKRVLMSQDAKVLVKSSIDIYNLVKMELVNLCQETLLALFLDAKCHVLEKRVMTIGTQARTLLDHKMIVSWALKCSATFVAIAHNHPSGDATPSSEDEASTETLLCACKMLGITLLDHLIIGKGQYYSFSKQKTIFIEE